MKYLRKLSVFSLLCLLVLISVETVNAEQAEVKQNDSADFVPGQVIVGMNPTNQMSRSGLNSNVFSGLNLADVEILLSPNTNTITRATRDASGQILLLDLVEDNKQSVLDAIEILEEHPDVAFAEPDYLIYGSQSIDNGEQLLNSRQNGSLLWNMERIGMPEAWQTTTGDAAIRVGVIDSGIDHTHPNLIKNVDTSLGYDFVLNRPDGTDVSNHGTFVAGVIGAVGQNTHNMVGVAPEVTMVSLRVLAPNSTGGTSGTSANIVRAIDHANDLDLDIINYSIGSSGHSIAIEKAIRAFNGLFVASAGNDSRDTDIAPKFPSALDIPNMISVGNSVENDERRPSSNWGRKTVDLFAPGFVTSTAPGNAFRTSSGTSYSAPHVAGAAALALSVNPSLTPVELKAAIMDTVDPVPALANLSVTGGRLNVASLVEHVSDEAVKVTPWEGSIEWVTRHDDNINLTNTTSVDVARDFADRHGRSAINLLIRDEDNRLLDLNDYEVIFSDQGVLGNSTTTSEWQARGHINLPILDSGTTMIRLQHKDTQEVEDLITIRVTPGELSTVRRISWVTRQDDNVNLTGESTIEVASDFVDRHGRSVINLLLNGEGNQPLDLTHYEVIFSTQNVLGDSTTTLEWQEQGHMHLPILRSGWTTVSLRHKETQAVEELLSFVVTSEDEEPETPVQPGDYTDWTPGQTWQQGDRVIYNGYIFESRHDFLCGGLVSWNPEDATALWKKIGSVATPEQPEVPEQPETPEVTAPAFDAVATYQGGDIVSYQGRIYRALWSTRGGSPATAVAWELVPVLHEDGSIDFNRSSTYFQGNLVRYEGRLYRARWWIQGDIPTTSSAWEFVGQVQN